MLFPETVPPAIQIFAPELAMDRNRFFHSVFPVKATSIQTRILINTVDGFRARRLMPHQTLPLLHLMRI
jgi:hypothetical protein